MTSITIRILHSTPPALVPALRVVAPVLVSALVPVLVPALVPALLGSGVTVEAVEERHMKKQLCAWSITIVVKPFLFAVFQLQLV